MTRGAAATRPPDIYSAEFAADPYPFYAQLRAPFPVTRDPVSGRYLIGRHSDVAAVLRGLDFSTRAYEQAVEPVYGRTLMQLDGCEHSASRGKSHRFSRPRACGVSSSPPSSAYARDS